jgi:hypothetical protein
MDGLSQPSRQSIEPVPSTSMLDINEPSHSADKRNERVASPEKNMMEAAISKEMDHHDHMTNIVGRKRMSRDDEGVGGVDYTSKGDQGAGAKNSEDNMPDVSSQKARVSIRAGSDAPLVGYIYRSFTIINLIKFLFFFLLLSALILYYIE